MDVLEVIRLLREKGCSDIYMKEGENISYRKFNLIGTMDFKVKAHHFTQISNVIFSDEIVSEQGRNMYGDFSFDCMGKIRCNLYRSSGKMSCVLRIVNNRIMTFEELGADSALAERIIERKGLSIVAGKTSSGKTNTVATVIDSILKKNKVHIITLEDPIEFEFSNHNGLINQRELGRDFYRFQEALKSALRQSPDIVFIGEIREKETLETALLASESGIAVLTTFHSLGAERTLNKIISFYGSSDRNFILNILGCEINFIQSQRLIRMKDNQSERLKLDYELLYNNKAVSNLIRDDKLSQIENQIILGKKSGMKLFEESMEWLPTIRENISYYEIWTNRAKSVMIYICRELIKEHL